MSYDVNHPALTHGLKESEKRMLASQQSNQRCVGMLRQMLRRSISIFHPSSVRRSRKSLRRVNQKTRRKRHQI